MNILIRNIKEIVQVEETPRLLVAGKDMANLSTLKNAWLLVQAGKITDFGEMSTVDKHESYLADDDEVTEIDVEGRMVFPAFCDSHTHLVFAGSREIEYVDKIKGLSYEEIAKRGGGILNSAKRMAEASEDELFETAMSRLYQIASMGTGAVEIKSGYGLSLESELKMLRVIKRLKAESPLTIKATFLGAHAVPENYKGKQSEYVDHIINEMIPQIATEELADYIDVFCDRGFFTVEETDRMLLAGMKHGLRPKIHANELDYSGGVQVGVKYNALSVDHLEYVGKDEISALKGTETMPTILPGAAFFLNMVYSPAREMIDAGLPVALASDYNPGSAPSGNMQFVLSMGCIKYRMLPEEAINATTINTAYAMGVSDILGSVARGKIANLIVTEPIPTYEYLPYAFGHNKAEMVILNGEII